MKKIKSYSRNILNITVLSSFIQVENSLCILCKLIFELGTNFFSAGIEKFCKEIENNLDVEKRKLFYLHHF